MDVRVLAGLALLGLGTVASAAVNDWTVLGPTGGAVNRIVYSKDGTQAFMAAANGFYRSQDSGVSWQLIKGDFYNAPFDVEIDPSDPKRLYVVTPSAPCLYVSTDGGATLTVVSSVPTAVTSANFLAVSADGNKLYLVDNGRVFYSTDRGQSFGERTAISTDQTTRVSKLLVDPADSNSLYAAVSTATTATAGIFATHDGGVSWQQLTSGPESTSLTDGLAFNPTNSAQIYAAQYDGIFVSADRGVHWSNLLSGAMTDIAIDPTNASILYAGAGSGQIYQSIDAGTTWLEVSGNITAGELPHLAVDPAQPTHLLVGGFSGVSGSATSGSTWTPQQAGFIATNVVSFSPDTAADRIYFNVTETGVFYTSGGGTSVSSVDNAALRTRSTLFDLQVWSILAQPGRLFANVDTGLTVSTDGGNTWGQLVDVPPPSGSEQVFFLTSSPTAPSTILAASAVALFKSTDGGGLWVPVSNGLPANSTASNLLFAASDPNVAYVALYTTGSGNPLGLYSSADAGSTWAAVNTDLAHSPTFLLAVDPSNASVVYGVNASNLLKSIDGGAHWSVLTFNVVGSPGLVLAVDPVRPATLYVSGPDGVARSVDGGASFETVRAATVFTSAVSTMLVDANRPENLLIGTAASGAQQITIAPDLSIAAAAPPATQVGIDATATYTYNVTNLGPFDATGVKFTVQLPATALNATATATGGGTCVISGSVATCSYDILRKAANSSVTVTAVAHTAGPFQVSASISGDQPDPVSSNDTLNSNATALQLADLSVTATGTAASKVGDALTYTLVAANKGPDVATAPQLTFQVAAGVTLGSVSSADATCTSAASSVTCTLNDLAVSQSVTVTVNATAAVAGSQVSTASVTSSVTDPSSTNNSASATTVVNAPSPSSSHGGGALSLNEILALAAMVWWIGRRRQERAS